MPPSIACPLPNLTIEWPYSGSGRNGPEVWKFILRLWIYKQRIHSDFQIAWYSSGKGSNGPEVWKKKLDSINM